MVSFIVSTFDRPLYLKQMLLCLKLQTYQDFEVIVTDNQINVAKSECNRNITKEFGYRYCLAQKDQCYASSEFAVKYCNGEFLCFPSDDDYYVPRFLELMMEKQKQGDLDLVYSDMVYEQTSPNPYLAINVEPKLYMIDKGGFILRKSCFKGFPGQMKSSPSDGLLVEEMVSRGVKHGKVNSVLFIHN
jgi:glycosyltransferase involved in cell wall biosynthesis